MSLVRPFRPLEPAGEKPLPDVPHGIVVLEEPGRMMFFHVFPPIKKERAGRCRRAPR
jgi:hypothetical protein